MEKDGLEVNSDTTSGSNTSSSASVSETNNIAHSPISSSDDSNVSDGLQNYPSLFTSLFSSDMIMPLPSLPDHFTTSPRYHSRASSGATSCALSISRPMDQVRTMLDSNLYKYDILKPQVMSDILFQELDRERNALREENDILRAAYEDLNRRFNCLLVHASTLQSCIVSPCSSSPTFASTDQPPKYEKAAGSGDYDHVVDLLSDFSPTSVLKEIDDYRINVDQKEDDRLSLPKSISVRASDYKKMNWSPLNIHNSNNHIGGNWNRDLKVEGSSTPPKHINTDKNQQQKMFLLEDEAAKDRMSAISKQGMYKTELCNNWRQKGTCHYGMSCQYAHGISELRPVIRHPKYKTDICRMILTGGKCPYGHRCHFRHSVTQE